MYSIIVPTYGIKGLSMLDSLLASMSKFKNPSLDEYGTSRECCKCHSKLTRRKYEEGFSYILCHSCGIKKDADLSAANVIATRCRDDMLKAGVITVKNGVSL